MIFEMLFAAARANANHNRIDHVIASMHKMNDRIKQLQARISELEAILKNGSTAKSR